MRENGGDPVYVWDTDVYTKSVVRSVSLYESYLHYVGNHKIVYIVKARKIFYKNADILLHQKMSQ